MLRRSPCASDPHTGHVPIRFRGFSIQPPSSKNPDIGFDGTSVSCVACWRGTACPDRASNPPRPAAGPLKSTHPANLLKFTAPTRGAWASGYGIASRCGDDVCVAVGPCIQARLEAGNCEEGFACLFQGRPYSRIRSALAVPCFFAAGCPRRVCRNPHSVCGLFWTLLPVLTCTVQPVGHFYQYVQT